MFPQVASNMVWNPNLPGYTNHGSFYVVATAGNSGSIGLDVTTPSGRDYNSKWNTTDRFPTSGGNGTCTVANCPNSGNSFNGKYSVMRGAHDQTGDPQFVDFQRSVELFDAKYLGHSPVAHPAGEACPSRCRSRAVPSCTPSPTITSP